MSEIKTPIYLDYSATTPIDPRVAKKMAQFLTPDGDFGNPASRSHEFGWVAEAAVDEARKNIADLVNKIAFGVAIWLAATRDTARIEAARGEPVGESIKPAKAA